MQKAIIGKKIGMTQIFDEKGRVVPVTVVEAGPCVVTQKKTVENDEMCIRDRHQRAVRRHELPQALFRPVRHGNRGDPPHLHGAV